MKEAQLKEQLQRQEEERLRQQKEHISRWEAASARWALEAKAAIVIQVRLLAA